MEIELPKQTVALLSEEAERQGISVEEAIRQSLAFYLRKVSDTPKAALSTKEAANALSVSTKTVHRLVAAGLIKPMLDISGKFTFSQKEIERYVADATTRSSGVKKGRRSSVKRTAAHTRR